VSAATLILAAIAVPLVGAVGIGLTGRRPNLRETVTLGSAAALFLVVLVLLGRFLDGEMLETAGVEMVPGVPLAFRIEPLGMIFALVASGLWIVNSIYSIGYMRGNNEAKQTRFYICFALALASTIGIAFAGNLLTLFVFYEALSLTTYPLVAHHEDEEAKRAGRTYLGLLMGTSIGFFLFAILLTWEAAGTLDFTVGGILEGEVAEGLSGVLLLLYMYGVGKAALMPMHRWLPAAMVAPTPVSALLHAVAVVKAGVFCVVKIAVYTFGIDYLTRLPTADVILAIAGFTILMASVIALRQDNLKRRLAYSTVSQLSYVVLGAFILAPLSVMGAAIHIAAHAFGKITLFFAAGSIYTAAHKTEVSQLDGIGRRMPWTMGAFTVGALSMIGVPPAAGFLSKWYMLLGAWGAGQWFAIFVIIASTLLNAAYFLPIVHAAFLKPLSPEAEAHPHGEAPVAIVIALTATAILTVLLFLAPGLALDLAGGLIGR
jgi:multicomponent Na+:H+ antiporter subunit D